MSYFAKRLRNLRKEQNLSQKQVSAQLKIQQSTFSSWETGKVVPLITDVIKIARILKTPAQDLVDLIVKDICGDETA